MNLDGRFLSKSDVPNIRVQGVHAELNLEHRDFSLGAVICK